jgi:hypothetical protein
MGTLELIPAIISSIIFVVFPVVMSVAFGLTKSFIKYKELLEKSDEKKRKERNEQNSKLVSKFSKSLELTENRIENNFKNEVEKIRHEFILFNKIQEQKNKNFEDDINTIKYVVFKQESKHEK